MSEKKIVEVMKAVEQFALWWKDAYRDQPCPENLLKAIFQAWSGVGPDDPAAKPSDGGAKEAKAIVFSQHASATLIGKMHNTNFWAFHRERPLLEDGWIAHEITIREISHAEAMALVGKGER